jgi:hypothetical protein
MFPRRVLLFALAGCSSGGGDDTVTIDAAVKMDAAGTDDATPLGCDVVMPDPVGIDRGKVGGTGGSKGAALFCKDVVRERIVGVAMQMSNQNTAFGGRSAQGIGIGCATVNIDRGGMPHVGSIDMRQVSGFGGSGWTPSTWTALTQCKPGWIVTGILAHTGAMANRFLDVTITCRKLNADASLGVSETLKVAGSLVDANGPDQVQCGATESLAQIGTFDGAGVDAIELFCGRPACR